MTERPVILEAWFIRNNWLNIKRVTDDPWDGEIVPTTSVFAWFRSPIWSIRTGWKILHTYHFEHKLDTVAQCVERWAPPNENDTATYAMNLSTWLGRPPEYELQWPRDYGSMLAGMVRQETGHHLVTPDMLQLAYDLAFPAEES